MSTLTHVWHRLIRKGHTFGTTPDVGRIFMACNRCARIVPAWRIVPSTKTTRVGCFCGSTFYAPVRIREWKAAWLVLSALVWRKWIWRMKDYDPRIPMVLHDVHT